MVVMVITIGRDGLTIDTRLRDDTTTQRHDYCTTPYTFHPPSPFSRVVNHVVFDTSGHYFAALLSPQPVTFFIYFRYLYVQQFCF
jgi:hypothetical protein